jgi:hypothetical protein
LPEDLRIHPVVRCNAKAKWFSMGLEAIDGIKQVWRCDQGAAS